VKKQEFTQNADRFVNEVRLIKGNYLQDKQINSSNRSIELLYSGYGLNDTTMTEIREKALKYRLDTSG